MGTVSFKAVVHEDNGRLCVYCIGISKEGWYIFKNLVTELAILAVGFLTFVPAIQVKYA